MELALGIVKAFLSNNRDVPDSLTESWKLGEQDINNISLDGAHIGCVDQQPSSKAVSKTAENPFIFLPLKDKGHLGFTVIRQPSGKGFPIGAVCVMKEKIPNPIQFGRRTLKEIG